MTGFRYTPQAVSTIRRHARTMAPATIASFLHCPVSMIESICKKHDIEIRDKDAFTRDIIEASEPDRKAVKKALEIQIDDVALRIVKSNARKRGVDTHTLIEMMIERIAEDELFGAVLDR
jgi:hypothetical protein